MSADSYPPARREAPGGPRPDLVWSETLFAAAEKWAKELARRNRGPKHADRSKMGENIAWSQYHVMSYGTTVRLWVDEKRFYHGEPVGDEDPSGKPIGHYTQVRGTLACDKCSSFDFRREGDACADLLILVSDYISASD